MSIELIDKIKPKNNGAFALVDAHDVAMPDGTRLDTWKGSKGGDIPTFDLVAIGLPTVPMDGTAVSVETDTAEILEALETGAVRFSTQTGQGGATFQVVLTVHDVVAGRLCSGVFEAFGVPLMMTILVEADKITATCLALAVDNGEEEGGNIPTFDLVALGLPELVSGGAEVSVETDTTEIREALETGAVRFRTKVEYMGVYFDILLTVHDVVAGAVCSGTFEVMGLPVMVTITVEDGKIKGSCLALVREERLEYDMEVPQFDLAYDGLPAVPVDGRQVFAQMDTESIRRALDKGPVRFWVKFLYDGETLNAKATLNATNAPSTGVYICSGTVDLNGAPLIFNMFVQESGIMAYFTAVAKAVQPATSINLSGLDTTGQIVETYADGSTKTTSLEFDADGNPIKITDGDGNVTELIW